SEIENELLGSKNMINAKLGFEAIYTFAYPFCAKETFGLTQKYYIAARSCKNDIEASTPKDFMDIGAVLCGSGTNYKSSTDFNGFAEKALAFNGWGVYLFHEIDGSGGNSIKSNDLSEHLAFLKKNNNSYWVDTFLNVVKYIKERNAVKVILGEVNDNVITINLSDGLDDTIYNYPLTIKKELPENWNINNIKVKHAGTLISHKLLQIANKNYIIFNAVPDQGKVEILKKS
ncbi:MAG: hypothetical protein NWQ38_10775, partial [Cellulophaga sp.]|nr:hypothetical protein [Cellulophaga sp.]